MYLTNFKFYFKKKKKMDITIQICKLENSTLSYKSIHYHEIIYVT